MRSFASLILAGLTLSACGSLPEPQSDGRLTAPADAPAADSALETSAPKIVSAAHPLQCVPYARARSGVAIYGDARTWWQAAAGRYPRETAPKIGAVLVLKQRGRSQGHLAVVRAVVDDREVIVDHANWLNRGRIHLGTPVRDVSPGGDWSAVRVWHTPSGQFGTGVYPVQGFILPTGA